MFLSIASRWWAALLLLAVVGCAGTSRTPANLDPHKQQLRAYVESGEYLREISKVAEQAKAWIEQRVTRGGSKLTAVFDLDETLFFNWPYLKATDFGYMVTEWDHWVDAGRAPPIEPVREIYRTARRHGVDVVFLTGRPEATRASTERNLRAIDCGEYAALICKPAGEHGTAAAFKIAARRQLTDAGATIIANIGDQESDLVGGFSERTFKLPNPFYLTE